MFLVQDKSNDEYKIVESVDANQINYNDNVVVWSNQGLKLTDIKTVKENLRRIDGLNGWNDKRPIEKTILTQWFCTTQENINSIFDKSEQVEIISRAYGVRLLDNSHESNGRNYFNKFRSELVYDYRNGLKTDVDIFGIESTLSGVTSKLITGDWLSAKALLSAIAPQGSFSQEIKDNLLLDFTTYITENY